LIILLKRFAEIEKLSSLHAKYFIVQTSICSFNDCFKSTTLNIEKSNILNMTQFTSNSCDLNIRSLKWT